MSDFIQVFKDRLQEIETYLDLLEALDKQVQQGPPRIGETGPTISVQQQRMLYSSVYLQLYNLIEATITNCIEAVTKAVADKGPWQPGDLSEALRREWVRSTARTHIELNHEKRLESAFLLCDLLVRALPVSEFKVEKGAGGSWDDNAIKEISLRMGFNLKVSEQVFSNVKRPYRDDLGPLQFIKNLRNALAHGSLSFAECGEGVTVADLRDLTERTTTYLEEVVLSFKSAIDTHEYLAPHRRPSSLNSD